MSRASAIPIIFSVALLLGRCGLADAWQYESPATPSKKLSVPTAEAQKRAKQMVEEIFSAKLKEAGFGEQKANVAKELLRLGTETRDDPAGRFMLYTMARDTAWGAGDWETTTAAVLRLAETYEVDGLAMKADLLAKSAKAPGGIKDVHGVYPRFQEVIEEALLADRFDVAKSTNTMMLLVAQQARDTETFKQVTAYAKQLNQLEGDFGKVKPALDVLKARPADETASLTVGRYWCFIKGDWKNGLPLLVQGNDKTLRELAQEELLTQPDALRLGESWWEVAQSLKGRAQEKVQLHSAEWYRKSPPQSGLMKARVESRLNSLPGPKMDASVAKAGSNKNTSTVAASVPPPISEMRGLLEATEILGGDAQKLIEKYSEGAVTINEHRYKIFKEAITWTEARDICAKLGGHLVIFEDKEERKAVVTKNKVGMVWIGAHRNDDGETVWLDGRNVEPPPKALTEDCRYLGINTKNIWQLRPLDGKLNDTLVKGFICEWDDAAVRHTEGESPP